MNRLTDLSNASVTAMLAEQIAVRVRQRKKIRYVQVARSRASVFYAGYLAGYIQWEEGDNLRLVGDDGAEEVVPKSRMGDGSHTITDFFIDHCAWA